MTDSEWLIPWAGRGTSWVVSDNLLWRSGRLYVMDNHRLALWCWWQHLGESDSWDFVHIDRHYDALWQTFNPWPRDTLPEHITDLAAFRSAMTKKTEAEDEEFELYRWDTITSALISLHSEQLLDVYLATADEGDRPLVARAREIKPWNLPGMIGYLSETEKQLQYPCIVDVDIDYFTHHDLDGAFGQVFSDSYIGEVGKHLYAGIRDGRFGVVTVALSPETTGSWQLAEHVLSVLLSSFPEFHGFAAGAPSA